MIVEKQAQLAAHSAALYSIAFGRTENTLFSAGGDRIVAEWDLEKAETNPFAIRLDSTIYSLLNLDFQVLLVGTSAGGIHVIDLHSKKELRHLKLHDKGVFHLHHDSIKNRIYSACGDGTVGVWDPKEWSLLWHLPVSKQKIRRIATNNNSSLVAFACGDGRCVILETKSHQIIHEIEAHVESCNSLAFLPNGTLITGGKDAYLRVWDIENGFQLIKEIPAHNYAIYDIILSEEGQWIASASRDKTIKIWDLELNEKPIRLDRPKKGGHLNSVNALLKIDTTRFASCSDDRSVIVWNIN